MQIIVSQYAGFCFGVARAIKLVEKFIDRLQPRAINQAQNVRLKKAIFMLGELVHNEHVMGKIEKKGVKIINSLSEINRNLYKKAILVITAHGIDPKIILAAKAKGLQVLDTTCPKVTRVHQMAKYLYRQGYKIFIFGDKDHVEVSGILGTVNNHAKVVENVSEAEKIKISPHDKVGLICQTTQDIENFEKIANIIKSKSKDCLIFNTICDSTRGRQMDAKNLALDSDSMIVVGSKKSANTKRLYQISKKINPKTYWINGKDEIKREWFSNVKVLGIMAGASTPYEVINDIVKSIKDIH